MNVLITGGKGFLGTNLTSLIGEKHSLTIYDKKDGNDIFDDKVEDEIKKNDIVLHLAAFTSVSKSFIDPNGAFITNALGTARIVRLCIKHNKKLVYPSSAMVFYPELSPYAYSKAITESIVKGSMNATPIVMFRFCNIFGPHMNADSGSMMYNFLNNDKIVVFGDGEQTRDFIHVKDVASIIEASFSSKWNGKIVDVGLGQAFSANYVANLFSYFREIPVTHELPKREMRSHITDTTVLKSLYKRNLTTNLEKDIQELCQDHLM